MNEGGTLWLPEQVSTLAPGMDALFYFVSWVSLIITVGVVATMFYFVYKYRRRDPNERPAPVKESKLVEISWIVVPTILVLVVFTWGFQGFIKANVAPANAYEIQVKGYKWAWEFTYPTGVTTGVLHVPEGRPVRLVMSSTDVIHSFYVPVFRVKHDVLPNRYTSVWFEATKTGEYDVFCTEYCGTEHSGMITKVVVMEQSEFNQWVLTGGMDNMSPVEIGALLYEQRGCKACHGLDGAAGVGPTFKGLYGAQRNFADGSSAEADENYLRESIIAPNTRVVEGYGPVMPSFAQLSEDEVSGLIAFIKEQE
ncbi:MAG: cytochrome c oxidase subunit II [Bacteroidota bacterium]